MPNRTCFKCRQSFFLPDGEKNIRCPACRSASRDKVCRKCSSPYRDETLKNTRRFCDSCVPSTPRVAVPTGESRVDPTRYQHMELGKLGERIYSAVNPTSDHVALRHPNSPFDFRDADGTTVNVRTRRPNVDSRWTWFRSPSPVARYWFIGLDTQGLTIEVVFAVPESAMPKRGFSYRRGSKTSWDRYRVDSLTHVPVSQFTPPSVQTEIDGLTPEYCARLTPQAKQDLVNRVVDYLRSQGFPYPLMLDDHKARLDFAQVRKYESQEDYPASSAGLKFLNPYMPHRYETRNHAATFSAVGAFQDDTRFRRTVSTMLGWERIDLSPSGVRSALTVLNRTPGHFPPAVAYSLVNEFCPDGGTVLDPCAGWGGRLLGTLLAGRQYVGIEAWDATATSLGRIGNRVVELLGSGSYRIVNQPFQDIEPVTADLILTCPPYWTIERYTEQDVDLDEWVQSFVKPFAQKCVECSDRVAMIMQDVTVGRRVVPLVEIWMNAMQDVGYLLVETRQMLRGQFGRATRDHDKVLLWQK